MKDIALFLYSKSEIMAKPWADSGIECHLFDMGMPDSRNGNIIKWGGDLRMRRKQLGELCRNNNVLVIACFSPCTDLAVAGARHFEKKALNDSMFWAVAMGLYWHGVFLADFFNIPYFCENPKTMITTLDDRKPDFKFHPCDFGGYLPEGHQHCLFPEIYPGRDAYNKETWIWCGNGFVPPVKIPVSPVSNDYPGWAKLGGKSERTKEIRSVTPEGFAKAVFVANYKSNLKIA
ncbi:hypothetical protein SAMN04488524_0592 [Pedobacter africanus]|uniref:Dcm methylase n=2 Tax=Pedobacter africanus TaxID=151894 RepID=A0A1W1ZDF0_9SPHI|nr:hypothetical protein SAMN04488524_0592 [Pedobacter africanus]